MRLGGLHDSSMMGDVMERLRDDGGGVDDGSGGGAAAVA